MNRLRTGILAVAVSAFCAMLATGPASALDIRNCTDIDIRVSVFKGKDKIKLVPVKGGKAAIGKGKNHRFRIDSGDFQIRAYRPKKLTLHIFEQRGLRGGKAYSIRGKKGHYSVSSDKNCPPPDAVLLPANGIWSTEGDKSIRIRRRSATSFDLTYLPNGKTETFEQDGKDLFTNGYTASFKIQSETRMVESNHLLGGMQSVYRFVRP